MKPFARSGDRELELQLSRICMRRLAIELELLILDPHADSLRPHALALERPKSPHAQLGRHEDVQL